MPPDELGVYLLLFVAATFAGALNVLAGAGSLLTIPILIFLGVPATTASGTVRLAVLTQNSAALLRFRGTHIVDSRALRNAALPLLLGAGVGAALGSQAPDEAFRRALGIITLVAAGLAVWQPDGGWRHRHAPNAIGRFAISLGIGLYGGFFHSGVGYLALLGGMWGFGFDLKKATGFKVGSVMIYAPLTLALFALNGKVHWPFAILVAVAQGFGAWVGAHLTVTRSMGFIRYVLLFGLLASGVKLLG